MQRPSETAPLRPIRTETDYDQALAEIWALSEAEPGSVEGVRLDVLTTLVEVYERAHHPVPPPDPV